MAYGTFDEQLVVTRDRDGSWVVVQCSDSMAEALDGFDLSDNGLVWNEPTPEPTHVGLYRMAITVHCDDGINGMLERIDPDWCLQVKKIESLYLIEPKGVPIMQDAQTPFPFSLRDKAQMLVTLDNQPMKYLSAEQRDQHAILTSQGNCVAYAQGYLNLSDALLRINAAWNRHLEPDQMHAALREIDTVCTDALVSVRHKDESDQMEAKDE